jgi:hypothetical protein
MQLHYNNNIIYIEKDINKATQSGYSAKVASGKHRHLSFLSIRDEEKVKRVIVDNEDSFIHLSNLIKEADIYFTSSYNSAIYKEQKAPHVYSWQNHDDIQWYQKKIKRIINEFSDQFTKIKPFIPIQPDLHYFENPSFIKAKLLNIQYRLYHIITGNNYWLPVMIRFDKRYNQLKKLRDNQLKYDVTLSDTLWGWPMHRINLHTNLFNLQNNHKISAILKWHQPYVYDGSDKLNLNEIDFPITTGPSIENYEKMLSESKLGIFATGFHWGWRVIMSIGLLTGIPLLIDEPLLEPYFDIKEFKLFYNTSHNWDGIDTLLNKINPDSWLNTKKHNQFVYDKYLSPKAVANYFINTIVAN